MAWKIVVVILFSDVLRDSLFHHQNMTIRMRAAFTANHGADFA